MPLLFNRPNNFYYDYNGKFSLRLVNVGIIHQKLEEIVGQKKTLISSLLFF